MEYNKGDLIGKLYAISTLLPLAAVVCLVCLVALKRSRYSLVLLSGQTANEVLNAVLKHIIQEPRPDATLRGGYGMPSSHAQFAGFLAIAWSFGVLRPSTVIFSSHASYNSFVKSLLSLGIWVASLIVSYSRYFPNLLYLATFFNAQARI